MTMSDGRSGRKRSIAAIGIVLNGLSGIEA
jgi:hypothetical protein